MLIEGLSVNVKVCTAVRASHHATPIAVKIPKTAHSAIVPMAK
jgi:hypothetical protein